MTSARYPGFTFSRDSRGSFLGTHEGGMFAVDVRRDANGFFAELLVNSAHDSGGVRWNIPQSKCEGTPAYVIAEANHRAALWASRGKGFRAVF